MELGQEGACLACTKLEAGYQVPHRVGMVARRQPSTWTGRLEALRVAHRSGFYAGLITELLTLCMVDMDSTNGVSGFHSTCHTHQEQDY